MELFYVFINENFNVFTANNYEALSELIAKGEDEELMADQLNFILLPIKRNHIVNQMNKYFSSNDKLLSHDNHFVIKNNITIDTEMEIKERMIIIKAPSKRNVFSEFLEIFYPEIALIPNVFSFAKI